MSPGQEEITLKAWHLLGDRTRTTEGDTARHKYRVKPEEEIKLKAHKEFKQQNR